MSFGSVGIGVSVIWIVCHCILHVFVRFLPSPAPGTPPRNIQAKGLSDRSFEATWLPPSQPNGYLLGYRLFYVTDPTLHIDRWFYMATGENQTQITGLRKMTTYYFKVHAFNSAGVGPLSDLFAVKTARGGEWSLARRPEAPVPYCFPCRSFLTRELGKKATGCNSRLANFSLLLSGKENRNKKI